MKSCWEKKKKKLKKHTNNKNQIQSANPTAPKKPAIQPTSAVAAQGKNQCPTQTQNHSRLNPTPSCLVKIPSRTGPNWTVPPLRALGSGPAEAIELLSSKREAHKEKRYRDRTTNLKYEGAGFRSPVLIYKSTTNKNAIMKTPKGVL